MIALPSEEDGVIRPADEIIPEDQTPEEDKEIEALPVTDDITATSGSCGNGLTWSYSSSTGVLTIYGNGAMNDFGRLETDGITVTSQPWSAYRNSMTSVVFTGNVTKIGIAAFFDCQALKSITLPDSVTQIGEYAFH